jgi:cyclic pyranopterin phosphate synthase
MSNESYIEIYTDGACKGNPGRGGWAAVIKHDGKHRVISGNETNTTNNRMELLAAIKGIETAPGVEEVVLFSDSTYLINTMTKKWKRKANTDLWKQLDNLTNVRRITWRWVKGHNGNPGNELADSMASQEAERVSHSTGITSNTSINRPNVLAEEQIVQSRRQTLTHLDETGRVGMVDVGGKPTTNREAVARGQVTMQLDTLRMIQEGLMKKGDVLTVAQLAGIMGAKRTHELIPLCHPLPLDQVEVKLKVDRIHRRVDVIATAKTSAKTGVEMEALTAVSVAALTVYDMCKSVDRGMHIEGIRLIRKLGGESGDLMIEEQP